MGDFLFQLVITHLPGRKKGGWMVLCVGSRLMEQPALLCLLTLYMFGRIPCSSLIMVVGESLRILNYGSY